MNDYEGRRRATGIIHADEMRESMQAKPTMEPPLAAACTVLNNEVSDLDQALKDLLTQLGPVMRPDYTDSDGRAEDPEPEMSEVTRFVRNESARVRELTSVVFSIQRRLEC